MSIFNRPVPDGKYSILAVGFPTCRHGLHFMECWNIHSQDYSFRGTFVPMMELSFSGPFIPWTIRSLEHSFPRTNKHCRPSLLGLDLGVIRSSFCGSASKFCGWLAGSSCKIRLRFSNVSSIGLVVSAFLLLLVLQAQELATYNPRRL